MSWTGKIKAALQGDVEGGDVLARLSATATLAGLRRGLADRRLDVEIAHVSETWRVPAELAPVAGLLFATEGMVGIARSLAEATAAAHPDRPASMPALTHGQLQVLLQPVDALQGEIRAALTDPHRRSGIMLPILARPFAHTAAGLMAERIPVPYLRGLLDGVAGLAGAAHLLLEDYCTLTAGPSTAPWLASSLATQGGDLAAADTRLEALQMRASSLLRQQGTDEAALRELAIDLWHLANIYLKLGQLIAAPELLQGARPAAPAPPEPPPIANPIAPSSATPPLPAAGGNEARTASTLPPSAAWMSDATPLAPAGSIQPPPVPPTNAARPVPETARTLPEIGLPAAAPPPAGDRIAHIPSVGVPAAGAAIPRSQRHVDAAPIPVVGPPTAAIPPARTARPPSAVPTPVPPASEPGRPRSLPQIGDPARTADQPGPHHEGPRPSPNPDPTGTPQAPGSAHQPVQARLHPDASASEQQAVQAEGRQIERKERWILSGGSVRHALRAAGREEQSDRELAGFWDAKGWVLLSAESRYLEQVAALVARGVASPSGRHFGDVPFAPIYRVGASAPPLLGQALPPGSLFSFDHRFGGRGLLPNLPAHAGVSDTA